MNIPLTHSADYTINNEAIWGANLPPSLTTNSNTSEVSESMAKHKISQCKLKRQSDFPIGKKYGRLTIIGEPFHFKCNTTKIKVKCDCGTYREVQINHLRSGVTSSCGCFQKERVSKNFGESNFNITYNNYKSRAKKYERPFKLTKKEFKSFVEGNCHYCGAKPNNITNHPECIGHYKYSGIDRVNNKKGYTIDNCVSCCKVCNRMKSSMGYDDFINHAKLISKLSNLFYAENAMDKNTIPAKAINSECFS